jgi:hypothetical protein
LLRRLKFSADRPRPRRLFGEGFCCFCTPCLGLNIRTLEPGPLTVKRFAGPAAAPCEALAVRRRHRPQQNRAARKFLLAFATAFA